MTQSFPKGHIEQSRNMRKNVFGRRFKRDTNERKALLRALMSSLVLDEKIKTTEAKAKSIKAGIDKLVTLAKNKEEDARRFLSEHLNQKAIDKMINVIAPQFKDRPGGYTRIIRMGNRISDSASMVVMEWTDQIIQVSQIKIQKPKKVKESKERKSSLKKTTVSKKKSSAAKAVSKKVSKSDSKTKKK